MALSSNGSEGGCAKVTTFRSLQRTTKLVWAIVSRGTEVESGSGNVDHILTGALLPEVSSEVLSPMSGTALTHVRVSAHTNKGFQYKIA
jgi:type VI secretion system protein VasG